MFLIGLRNGQAKKIGFNVSGNPSGITRFVYAESNVICTWEICNSLGIFPIIKCMGGKYDLSFKKVVLLYKNFTFQSSSSFKALGGKPFTFGCTNHTTISYNNDSTGAKQIIIFLNSY